MLYRRCHENEGFLLPWETEVSGFFFFFGLLDDLPVAMSVPAAICGRDLQYASNSAQS